MPTWKVKNKDHVIIVTQKICIHMYSIVQMSWILCSRSATCKIMKVGNFLYFMFPVCSSVSLSVSNHWFLEVAFVPENMGGQHKLHCRRILLLESVVSMA